MNAKIDRRWLYPLSLLAIYTLSLSAYATSSGETSTVRLVGGAGPSEGRLEVLYNGTWGTVCNDFFSFPDGSVVCRQLSYIGVLSISSSLFGAGEGPIWLDDVDCTGSEDSIVNCNHNDFGVHNCNHTEDVGIICDTQSNAEDGALRLVAGDSISNGRVEIFHDGEWGTVCDRQWDINDATVVCRQLGFQGAGAALGRSHYGAGIGTIWLSDVHCTGSESRLDQCNHGGWGEISRCYHRINDASVQCEGDISTLAPPQIESSSRTTTYYKIVPSSTTLRRHTAIPSLQVSPTTTKQPSLFTHSASQMLPRQSTLPTTSDVGDNLPQMELILGLVALGVLMLTSAILLSVVIMITVCVCRSKRSKSVHVEDFQSANFPPSAGLVGKFEDSEVVLTNANTQMSRAYASHSLV